MPVNPKTGQKYRISDDGRNRLHIYGTPGKKGVRRASADYRVVRMARPQGYSYNPKNTQYYRIQDNGLTRTHIYQNGRKVNAGPGSTFRAIPGLQGYYKAGKAIADLKYGVPQQTLKTQMGRERTAQDQAYRQIAGYYSGLAGNARDLMGQAGQVGRQTDQQLQQIGADRNAQVQQATPQYGGALGEVAQRMANSESQAAMNRGSAIDSAARGFNANVSGSRQALLGQIGAAQQVAGQERLQTLRGVGQQALNVYGDKISELERQKGLGAVDSALQLRSSDQTYNLNRQRVGIQQQNADTSQYRAQNPPSSGGGGSSPRPRSSAPKGTGYGATKAANLSYWNEVSKAVALMKNNPKALRNMATYRAFANRYGEPVAAVARSIVFTGGLTPYAVGVMHQAGYAAEGRYKPVSTTRRPVTVSV